MAPLHRPVPKAAHPMTVILGQLFTGVSIGAGREVTIERASLATGLRALLSRRIEDAALSIEGSRIDVRWALALFELLSADQPSAAAGSSGGVTIVSVTALNLRRIDLVAAGRKAGDLVNRIAAVSGGKGGGRPHFASAGAGDPARLPAAREATPAILAAWLNGG